VGGKTGSRTGSVTGSIEESPFAWEKRAISQDLAKEFVSNETSGEAKRGAVERANYSGKCSMATAYVKYPYLAS
jgi:hypothetical protein